MSDGNINPIEAYHMQGQEAEDAAASDPDVSEGEESDELDPTNDPNKIGDAIAANRMDKQNQGGATVKFANAVKKSARWTRKNGLSYLWLTATSSGVGIAVTELANQAELLNHTPTQRVATYGLGLAIGYKTVKAGRYIGNVAAILGSSLSDGISRTPLVKDFKYFKKRFGTNKRYTDLQKRDLGTLKGRVAASALIAATMPAWPWIGKQAGWVVTNTPDAVSNTYHFIGNGVNGNRARMEQDARGAEDSLRVFTPEKYDGEYLPLTLDGQEDIKVLDQDGNVVTLRLIYDEKAAGNEENPAANDNPANDAEGAPEATRAPAVN